MPEAVSWIQWRYEELDSGRFADSFAPLRLSCRAPLPATPQVEAEHVRERLEPP
jgi:hypothetical protein